MAKVPEQAPLLLTGGMIATAVCFAVVLISTLSVSVEGLPILGPDLKTCTPVIPRLAIGSESIIDCCMIDNGKPIKDFKFDENLPMRVRRPAHKLDEEEISKYDRALRLMRALPASDPRSHIAQANIHCAYCEDAYNHLNSTSLDFLDVHHCWLFLPYHRWYLYFYERILAKLIDDDTFAVPYWAWDAQLENDPPANVMPAAYLRENSSLYDEYRSQANMPPVRADLQSHSLGNKTPDELVEDNSRIMWGMMIGDVKTPEAFYGEKYSRGDQKFVGDAVFESTAHTAVHRWVGVAEMDGVDLAPAWSSAREPMFYAHHAEVDRLWVLWKEWGGKDLTHPDWLNAEYLFYDENGDLVRVNVRDSLNEEKLRFRYEQVDADWKDYKPKSIRDIDPKYVRAGILRRFSRQVLAAETYTSIANAFLGYFQPAKNGAQVSFGGVKRAVVTSRLSVPEVIESSSDAESSVYDEVLIIEGVVEKPFDADVRFNIFLELPEADESTSRTCVEFLSTISVDGTSNGRHPIVSRRFRRTIGIGERLQILDSVRQKSVTITFVPVWDQQHNSDVSVRVTELIVERKLAR